MKKQNGDVRGRLACHCVGVSLYCVKKRKLKNIVATFVGGKEHLEPIGQDAQQLGTHTQRERERERERETRAEREKGTE